MSTVVASARRQWTEGPVVAAGVLVLLLVIYASSADLFSSFTLQAVCNDSAALALARSLVCQAAVHHGPADMQIAVLTEREEMAAWEWTKWLPHTRDTAAGGGARMLQCRRSKKLIKV